MVDEGMPSQRGVPNERVRVPSGWIGQLEGRTALVTGAGNGLGRAIAAALVACHTRVILVGRDVTKLNESMRVLTDSLSSLRIATADLAQSESVANLAEELCDEEISILVNNAGVPGPVLPLTEVATSEWDDVFSSNVRSIFLMCRSFVPPMMNRQFGDVINIASVSGKRPLAFRSPYCASKMAVIGLTTTLAAEVGQYGVRVNSLSPGPVSGPRMDRNFAFEAERLGITVEDAERAFRSRALLNRLVEEDEVGAAVIAMLHMPGLHAADIDLSAGMVAK